MSTAEAVVAGVAAWIILPGACFIGAAVIYDWWLGLHQLDTRIGRGRTGLWEFELDALADVEVLDLTDVEAEEFLDTLEEIRGLATR